MLVNLDGHVIDTKKVWRVSPIDKSAHYAQFHVYFLNGNVHTVHAHINGGNHLEPVNALTRAREEFISYWNKSRNKIPEIKL